MDYGSLQPIQGLFWCTLGRGFGYKSGAAAVKWQFMDFEWPAWVVWPWVRDSGWLASGFGMSKHTQAPGEGRRRWGGGGGDNSRILYHILVKLLL